MDSPRFPFHWRPVPYAIVISTVVMAEKMYADSDTTRHPSGESQYPPARGHVTQAATDTSHTRSSHARWSHHKEADVVT
eukprot:3514141-Rhodomonas_salina.2